MLQDIITKGSTDRSVTVKILDSGDGTPETGVVFNTSGIDLWYRREGAARVAITEATLSALTDAHADGGFLHVSDGVYRLDLPDAAFATGANYVDFGGTVTGMVVIGGRVRLVDFSLEDAVRMGLTALPNVAAGANGGLPLGNGSGQVALQDDGITAAKLATDAGTELGSAVWASATRTLTAIDEDATTLDLDATIRASIGMASADLDSQLSAINSKTTNLPTDPADQSLIIAATDVITGLLGTPAGASVSADIAAVKADSAAILVDTGTDGVVVAAASKSDYRLSGTGVDDILDEAIEGSVTLRQSVRLANSALGGKASGLETTEATFRDLADTKDRLVVTVDADGNRSAVTRDLT